MKFIIETIKTKAVSGGSDNLLDVDLMKELSNYMRVRPKGYAFSPLYKKHIWDGWRRFIGTRGDFATGFLPMVSMFISEFDTDIIIEDQRNPDNMIYLNEGEDFITYLGNINGKDWHGRDYQINMAKKVNNYLELGDQKLYFPRGILNCATNAGKNSIAALIMLNVPKDTDMIFTVSSVLIFKQAYKFFCQVFPDEKIGVVASGDINLQRITIVMVKTALNQAKASINFQAWLKRQKLLIVDESDESGANDYTKLLQYVGADMRVLMSGTPLDGSNVSAMIGIGHGGKILGTITNKEMIEAGVSQKPKVKIILNDSDNLLLSKGYIDELERLVYYSEIRINLMIGVISKITQKDIVVSYSDIAHGYFIYEKLSKAFPHLRIGIIHSKHQDYECDRDGTLAAYVKGDLDILVSSMILKRGANIPNIRTMIAGQGGKSKITVKQFTIGRSIRHDGENEEVDIYDFYDTGKIVSKHSAERIKIYLAEGFDVEFLYENKKGKPIITQKSKIL